MSMIFDMSETEDKDWPNISRKVANQRTENHKGDTCKNQSITTARSCMFG